MRLKISSRFSDVRWGALARVQRRFAPHLRRYRRQLLASFAFLLLAMAMVLLKPWPLKVVFDHVLPTATGTTPVLPGYLDWLIHLDGEKTSIKGPLTRWDPATRELVFGAMRAKLPPGVSLKDEVTGRLSPEDLRPGDRLKVRLSLRHDGYQAKSVLRLEGTGGAYRLRGPIENVDADGRAFRLLGLRVVTDDATEWLGLTVVQRGAWLNVKGEFEGELLDAREVARPDPAHILLVALVAVLVFAALEGLFGYVHAILATRVAHQVVFRVRRDLFAHVQRLPLAFHDRRDTGDLLVRLTGDVQVVRDVLVQSVLTVLGRLVMMIGMLAVMFVLSPQLALVGLLVIPMIGLVLLRFSVSLRSAARRQRKKEGRLATVMNEALQSIAVVQSHHREDHEDEKLKRENRSSMRAGLRATKLEERMSWVTEVLMAIGTCLVLGLGVRQTLAGLLTPGELLVFLAYTRGLYKPMRKLTRISARLSKASACAERILDLLELEPRLRDRADAIDAPPFAGSIELDAVTLRYQDGGPPALDRLSLKLAPAETVLLVGPSGSGKTSIARLILRLYEPTEGVVRIDGRDVRDYRLETLRRQVSLVLQEPVLFGASIRENIAYGKPDAEDDEIVEAARRVHADEFIERLPESYDTVLGERGVTLSGGQRKRIALARAAIRKAPILILDEPTEGLDADSAQAMLRGMEALLGTATTLIVSHDPEALSGIDRVIALEHGAVVSDTRPVLPASALGERRLAPPDGGVAS